METVKLSQFFTDKVITNHTERIDNSILCSNLKSRNYAALQNVPS